MTVFAPIASASVITTTAENARCLARRRAPYLASRRHALHAATTPSPPLVIDPAPRAEHRAQSLAERRDDDVPRCDAAARSARESARGAGGEISFDEIAHRRAELLAERARIQEQERADQRADQAARDRADHVAVRDFAWNQPLGPRIRDDALEPLRLGDGGRAPACRIR